MKPSAAFEQNRHAIKAVIARYAVSNPRLFGSAAKGQDREDSDLDLLVDALPGTTLLDLIGLELELADMLGIRVDVRTPNEFGPSSQARILAEALPL